MNKFFILCLLFVATASTAQNIQQEHFTVADGLSQGMITAIFQDREGFIWAGTMGGINRFDGRQFKRYAHQYNDSTSLKDNITMDLYEDRRGRTWILTENQQLECFDRQTGIFHHLGVAYNPLHLDAKAWRICESKSGLLWVASSAGITQIKVPEEFPQQPQSTGQIQYKEYSLDRDFPDHGDNELYMKVVEDSAVAVITNKICRVFDEQTSQYVSLPWFFYI